MSATATTCMSTLPVSVQRVIRAQAHSLTETQLQQLSRLPPDVRCEGLNRLFEGVSAADVLTYFLTAAAHCESPLPVPAAADGGRLRRSHHRHSFDPSFADSQCTMVTVSSSSCSPSGDRSSGSMDREVLGAAIARTLYSDINHAARESSSSSKGRSAGEEEEEALPATVTKRVCESGLKSPPEAVSETTLGERCEDSKTAASVAVKAITAAREIVSVEDAKASTSIQAAAATVVIPHLFFDKIHAEQQRLGEEEEQRAAITRDISPSLHPPPNARRMVKYVDVNAQGQARLPNNGMNRSNPREEGGGGGSDSARDLKGRNHKAVAACPGGMTESQLLEYHCYLARQQQRQKPLKYLNAPPASSLLHEEEVELAYTELGCRSNTSLSAMPSADSVVISQQHKGLQQKRVPATTNTVTVLPKSPRGGKQRAAPPSSSGGAAATSIGVSNTTLKAAESRPHSPRDTVKVKTITTTTTAAGSAARRALASATTPSSPNEAAVAAVTGGAGGKESLLTPRGGPQSRSHTGTPRSPRTLLSMTIGTSPVSPRLTTASTTTSTRVGGPGLCNPVARSTVRRGAAWHAASGRYITHPNQLLRTMTPPPSGGRTLVAAGVKSGCDSPHSLKLLASAHSPLVSSALAVTITPKSTPAGGAVSVSSATSRHIGKDSTAKQQRREVPEAPGVFVRSRSATILTDSGVKNACRGRLRREATTSTSLTPTSATASATIATTNTFYRVKTANCMSGSAAAGVTAGSSGDCIFQRLLSCRGEKAHYMLAAEAEAEAAFTSVAAPQQSYATYEIRGVAQDGTSSCGTAPVLQPRSARFTLLQQQQPCSFQRIASTLPCATPRRSLADASVTMSRALLDMGVNTMPRDSGEFVRASTSGGGTAAAAAAAAAGRPVSPHAGRSRSSKVKKRAVGAKSGSNADVNNNNKGSSLSAFERLYSCAANAGAAGRAASGNSLGDENAAPCSFQRQQSRVKLVTRTPVRRNNPNAQQQQQNFAEVFARTSSRPAARRAVHHHHPVVDVPPPLVGYKRHEEEDATRRTQEHNPQMVALSLKSGAARPTLLSK